MRSRFFRQIVQKPRRHTVVCQGISVQYYGKRSSRFGEKPSGGLCAVLPLYIDDITLARKCNISPMNIVNIKKGSRTYSQQLVENIGRGLELSADEMSEFMGAAGF